MRPVTVAAAVLATLLAGCGSQGAPTGYRDMTAILASKADFDPLRIAGTWHEVARYRAAASPCPAPVLRVSATPEALDVREGCSSSERVWRGVLSGPGRFAVAGPGGTAEWLVLWADEAYRTIVLVRRDGGGGRVLDRSPNLPEDRRRAVSEVLDFNGFDASALAFRGQDSDI